MCRVRDTRTYDIGAILRSLSLYVIAIEALQAIFKWNDPSLEYYDEMARSIS